MLPQLLRILLLAIMLVPMTLVLGARGAAQDLDQVESKPGGAPPASPSGLPAGMTAERMWPAPTRADWEKPVLVEFQRTWADAVAVARETGKAILVCINMDGEIASEHYAGVHYRTPETAALFKPYVCVIASVYRHTPRDHDEHGNRILCPRLGSVTCGEHIAIEPILYEKFMDGRRISPRHIMVELDGREMYDVFYAWDNQSIFTTIRDGIANRERAPNNIVRGDRPIVERVASRDIQDRQAVETAFQSGDRELRQKLLEMAQQHPEATPVELLRLAVFSVDAELAKLARQALVRIKSPEAVEVISEALRVPLEDQEREALLAALERLRHASPRAALLANVHRGLEKASTAVDVQRWSSAMSGGATYAPADDEALDRRLADEEASVKADTGDAVARLDLAETTLERALDPSQVSGQTSPALGRRFRQLLLEEARGHAEKAQQMGADEWRVDAILGLVAYYGGDKAQAHERAIRAAQKLPADPQSWTAVATLALFAEARIDAIWDALRRKADWPGEWMTDVSSVYSVLAKHPLGTDQHALTHYDFLQSLGAKRRAGGVLEDGLRRFPASWPLHDRFRVRVLDERGVDGLEPAYEELLAKAGATASLRWFSAYASIVVAEFQRRKGAPALADAAYDRALAAYERVIADQPEWHANSDHYAALALAGKARLAVERGELEPALALLLTAIGRCAEAVPALDGLNISPAMTAKLLESKLVDAHLDGPLQQLQQALSQLDPVLLEPPEYEKEAPLPPAEPQRPPRRRR